MESDIIYGLTGVAIYITVYILVWLMHGRTFRGD